MRTLTLSSGHSSSGSPRFEGVLLLLVAGLVRPLDGATVSPSSSTQSAVSSSNETTTNTPTELSTSDHHGVQLVNIRWYYVDGPMVVTVFLLFVITVCLCEVLFVLLLRFKSIYMLRLFIIEQCAVRRDSHLKDKQT